MGEGASRAHFVAIRNLAADCCSACDWATNCSVALDELDGSSAWALASSAIEALCC